MTSSGTNNPSDPIRRDVSAGDMTCQMAQSIMHRRIDAEASPDELGRPDAHLAQCDSCSRYAAEMAGVMSQMAALRSATEIPPVATTQSLERSINDQQRPRFAPTLLRIAAVIAIGFAGLWAWSASQERSSVLFVGVGPNFVDTNSIGSNAGISDNVGLPPGLGAGDHSLDRAARVINPRSDESTYITVQRDTGRANVKMFALYERVQ